MEDNKKNEVKPMPSSDEAERALLSCLIDGGEREYEIAMAWIREDDAFYYTDNKIIWKAFKELIKNDVQIDFVTLSDRVKEYKGENMAYYITGLGDVLKHKSNIENYARIIWEKYIQRETAKSAQSLLNASY